MLTSSEKHCELGHVYSESITLMYVCVPMFDGLMNVWSVVNKYSERCFVRFPVVSNNVLLH